jgi:hypothetical protein
MPVSNDNQDYGKSDEKNKENQSDQSKLTSDDLKGKKIDADLDKEKDRPAEQNKDRQ